MRSRGRNPAATPAIDRNLCAPVLEPEELFFGTNFRCQFQLGQSFTRPLFVDVNKDGLIDILQACSATELGLGPFLVLFLAKPGDSFGVSRAEFKPGAPGAGLEGLFNAPGTYPPGARFPDRVTRLASESNCLGASGDKGCSIAGVAVGRVLPQVDGDQLVMLIRTSINKPTADEVRVYTPDLENVGVIPLDISPTAEGVSDCPSPCEVPRWKSAFLGLDDIDGDGLDDIILSSRTLVTKSATSYAARVPVGLLRGAPGTAEARSSLGVVGSYILSNGDDWQFIDVNGDGRRDLVSTTAEGTGRRALVQLGRPIDELTKLDKDGRAPPDRYLVPNVLTRSFSIAGGSYGRDFEGYPVAQPTTTRATCAPPVD